MSTFPVSSKHPVKMLNSRILVAQMGARRHYLEPILFNELGILDSLYTDFYLGSNKVTKLFRSPRIYNCLPKILQKSLDRYDPSLDNARVIHFPGFAYKYAQALKKTSLQEVSTICLWGGKEFCNRVVQNGLGNATIVYGFNGAALELFEDAKIQGISCILDQTLAERSLVQQILLEEEQRWPEWSSSPFVVNDSDLELAQRENLEQELADHIVCGSDFVKNSLTTRGVNASKISVVAMGRRKDTQPPQSRHNHKTPQERGDGLRILFAGAVSLRKGIPYLLKALQLLKGEIPFTCKAAGFLEIQPQRIAEYSDVCRFLGQVPRSQMVDLYAWADVFVLPSLCEGSAMVTYEALSYGLPVITTYNAGSIVQNGVNGFIVSVRDIEALAEKLDYCYKADRGSFNYLSSLNSIYKSSESILKEAILSLA